MEMCRFAGHDDVEYKKVAAALQRMAATLSRQPLRGEKSLVLEDKQKQALLESLRFHQIDARRMAIKNAHAETCRWLLKDPSYVKWLGTNSFDEHHGLLCIKGKPGTGKSTLMKFARSHALDKMKDTIVISFFFNARGDDLEKSTIGMYRSILLQLLERLPTLQVVFDSLELTTWNGGYLQWSVESLKTLLERALQNLGKSPLVLFIDALDECDEYQIRDMVSFFEQVGQFTTSPGIKLRVCFSSRHYPHISIAKGLSLVLEGQEGHEQDIASYIHSELKIGQTILAEQIRTDLREKASGIFMWVVLVVRILNKEFDGGRIHTLRQRLKNIPGDLHQLFCDILTRDQHNKGELLLCIQWVLFARQPLKPEELYFAILSGTEDGPVFRWNHDEITICDMKRFILDTSKGLIEVVTGPWTTTVQFIHESVKDFLLKDDGLQRIWSGPGGNFQGESHERLKQCCVSYMGIGLADLHIGDILPRPSSQRAKELPALHESANETFPFLQYAVQNILYHADAAEGGGIDQTRFFQAFRLADWINLDNLFEIQGRRHPPTASLLYILAKHNMANLIRRHPSRSACFEVGDELYGPPNFCGVS